MQSSLDECFHIFSHYALTSSASTVEIHFTMDFSDDDNNFGIGTIDDEYEDEAIDAGFNEKLLHDESIDSKSDVETDSEEEFPSESSSLSSEGYGRGVVQHVDVSANVYGRGRGRGRGKSVVFETPSEEFVVPPNPQGRGRYGTIDPGGGSQSLVSPMSDESSSKMRKAKLHVTQLDFLFSTTNSRCFLI